MKKWLYSFKFILIIILFIVFTAYYYLTKDSKESFQQQQQQTNDGDYHYPHFDISANYYNLTQAEKAQMKATNPDSIILNIGNSLGEGIDINNIPWDSENNSLQPSEILWGAVSREASADIFNKVYVARQLAALKAEEDNESYFDSALLHYGTADPELGAVLEITDFIANFAVPLVVPMIGEKMGGHDPIFPEDVPESPVTKQTNAAKKIGGPNGVMDPVTEKRPYNGMKAKQHSRVSHILSPDKKPDPPGKLQESPTSRFTRLKSQLFKMKGTRLLGKLILLFFDWIELIPPPVGPVLNFIYMVFIMPAVMAIAMPLIAPRKGSNAEVENRIIGVYTTLAAMAVTAGIGIIPAFQMLPGVQAAAVAAALAGALAAYYEAKVAIPAGYRSAMEKMIELTGHGSGNGKCPNGYVPMNQLWNPTTEIFLSFVPIFGDLIDLIYPYMCIRRDFTTPANDRAQNFIENLVCVRDPYILPKYMEQSWISSMFLDWPDYNNKLSTPTNMVGGKLRIVPTGISFNAESILDSLLTGTNRTTPYWSWSGYTNFNDIKNNPQNYYNLNVKLEDFNEKRIYQYIGGKSSQDSPNPSLSCKFFYLDFSDPNILVEMAQFYYNYAIRNAQIGDDRTFTIEYIAKINYVIASSLFTCDAMCEMVTIKYDARSGTIVKQTRSYDADRRFYFRWRGNSGPPNYTGECMTPSDIWGNNAGNTIWRGLDDRYDDAMYNLNDAIHFPNEPGSDSTGLISGEVLLTAYELYKEQKERSDLASSYIVSVNPLFKINTEPNTKTLQQLKQEYELLDTERINRIIGSLISDIINSAYSYLGIVNSMPSFLNSISTIRDIFTYSSKVNSLSSALSNLTNTINIAYQFVIDDVNNIPIPTKINIENIRNSINNNILIDLIYATTVYFNDSSNDTKLQDARTKLSIVLSNANLIIEKATVANNNIIITGQLGNTETYTQSQNTLQVNFKLASDDLERVLQAVDPFYLDFKINTDTARKNYLDVLGKLYTSNENPNIFFQNDLDFRGPVLRDLQSRMEAVIKARKDLWDRHKIDVSTNPTATDVSNLNYKYGLDNTFMTSKYYDVTGCTHLDGGALAVITPDVINLQEDIRFPANFDVLPHLKRCENINITLDKCIDLSNVEQVIQAYERDMPTKRIKTIHNIQARGNNTCQYIWDEYDLATPTTITQTTNRILYQQDLSACTFCLPETSGTPKVQKIYIDSSDNKVDIYDAEGNKSIGTTNITTSLTVGPPTSLKQFSLNVSDSKNINPTLTFLKATYNKPTLLPDGGQPVVFRPLTGQLLVPRYDPIAYKKLPDLVRPKKPIRVSYPNGVESQLGGQTNNFCSDPINMSNFMIDYNNTNDNKEKIVNIQRGFTTGPTTCDYEIDVFIKDPKKPNDPILPYLTTNITNILSINNSGTTIQVGSVTGFTKGMIVNISYAGGSITYITSEPPTYTRVNHNNINPTTQNDIFQAISGLLKITNIDVSNNRITYLNNTLPEYIVLPINTGISGSGIIELKNVVTRKTVSYNMATYPRPEAFTNTPYTYNTIGTTGGLEIKKNTPTLQGSFSNTGYNFGGPAKSNADKTFGSNTNFYNDNLVRDYTTKMSNLLSNTSEYLKPLMQAITLSNLVGTPQTNVCATQPNNPPTNVCSNPTYMQRIMDAYNNGNSPIGIYNQERNTMTRIIQASTASNNECRIIFENKNEFYSDRTYYDSNNSNNYTVTNTLKFINVPMVPTGGTCDFIPKKIPLSNVIGANTISIYPPIKASDLTLSYGNNLAPYAIPLRTSDICQVADTPALFNSLSNNYFTNVNLATNPLRFTTITKLRSLQIGYDKIDYLVEQKNTAVTPNITRRFVLRGKFDLAPYPAACSWSYTNGSFKLQIVLPDSMTAADKATYTSQSFVDVVNTNSVSLGGSDTVSPLFFDPEYS